MLRHRVFAGTAPLLLLALGACAPAAAEDVDDTEDAITHSEAAAQHEFSALLFKDDQRSVTNATRALGVASWAGYTISDKRFLGVGLFASDAAGQVRYALLLNARRAADGKADVAVLEVDKAGNRSPKITPATYSALLGDLEHLQRSLRSASDVPRTAGQRCAAGLTVAVAGALIAGGAAAIAGWGAVTGWAALGAEGSSVLAVFEATGLGANAITFATIAGGAIVATYQESKEDIAQCTK